MAPIIAKCLQGQGSAPDALAFDHASASKAVSEEPERKSGLYSRRMGRAKKATRGKTYEKVKLDKRAVKPFQWYGVFRRRRNRESQRLCLPLRLGRSEDREYVTMIHQRRAIK